MIDRATTTRSLALLAALGLLLTGAGCSSGSKEAEGGAAESGTAEAGDNAEGAKAKAGEEGEGQETAEPGRVTLSEAAFATAAIQTESVRTEGAGAAGSGSLQAPGQVEFDPARVAVVSPRTAGRIERLTVVPGQRVAPGQTVALISSPAFLTAQSDLSQAVRRAEVLSGTSDEQGARALVSAARRRLQLLGAGKAAIGRIERGGEPSAVLGVPAPFGGSILEILAPAGSAVEAGTPIFRIADLSTVLVAADIPEQGMAALRIGQPATVRLNAVVGQTFAGRIERIGDVVDPQSRTLKAYVRVANAGRTLRPGMFASVALESPVAGGAPQAPVLTIPQSAVVTDGDARYVFVEVGPRSYERRAIEVSAGAGGRMVVTSGVAAGESVVSRGAFTLKSELGKAAFGEDDD